MRSFLLALPLLSLVLASPAPVARAALADAEAAPLASRTFDITPNLWGSGGWWGQNSCADPSKSNHCFSRGFGWGCDNNCNCVPPSGDVCKDDNKWRSCKGKGVGWGCGSSCECTPPPQTCQDTIYQDCTRKGKGMNQQCVCECRPWVKWYCHKSGGYLSDSCQCTYPSKRSHPRNLATIKRGVCPESFEACATNVRAKRPTFQCVDTTSALDSCGGCASEGLGVDCTQLEGASDVACTKGACVVSRCERGWTVVGNGTSCERVAEQGEGRKAQIAAFLRGAEKVLY